MITIKILLTEDHKIVREGIKSLLKNEPGITIVGESSDGKAALRCLTETKVDVILLDINMPGMDGLEVARIVKKDFPSTKILILSMLNNEHFVKRALEMGVSGYASKDIGKSELILALNKIMAGDSYISSEIALKLVGNVGETYENIQTPDFFATDLSKREVQILKLIAEGYTNTEIADKVFLSKRTVESHRKSLMEKTNAKNTATLIRSAIRNNIIT